MVKPTMAVSGAITIAADFVSKACRVADPAGHDLL